MEVAEGNGSGDYREETYQRYTAIRLAYPLYRPNSLHRPSDIFRQPPSSTSGSLSSSDRSDQMEPGKPPGSTETDETSANLSTTLYLCPLDAYRSTTATESALYTTYTYACTRRRRADVLSKLYACDAGAGGGWGIWVWVQLPGVEKSIAHFEITMYYDHE